MAATQAATPCWYVASDGKPWPEDADMIPHFTTRAAGETALAIDRQLYIENLDEPTPVDDLVKLDLEPTGPCWFVTCDRCGVEFEGEEGASHLDTPGEVAAYGWIVLEDRYLCEGCADDTDARDPAQDRLPGPGQESLL